MFVITDQTCRREATQRARGSRHADAGSGKRDTTHQCVNLKLKKCKKKKRYVGCKPRLDVLGHLGGVWHMTRESAPYYNRI